jgi:hypothetical protein
MRKGIDERANEMALVGVGGAIFGGRIRMELLGVDAKGRDWHGYGYVA